MLAAYRGDEAQAVPLLDATLHDATARGQGLALSMIGCARAVLFNGLARYEEAVTAAAPALAEDGLGLYSLALVELIEGAVRSERPELLPGAQIPHPGRTVLAGGDHAAAVWTELRVLDPVRVLEGEGDRLPGACIPDPHHPVAHHREQPAAVGAERQVVIIPHPGAYHFGPAAEDALGEGPSLDAASCWPPARPRAGARRTRSACSRRRKRRSLGWPQTG